MLASDHVVYLDGVADSPNVRIVGAHLIIYPNATALANAGSCGLCEAGFGTNTNRQDNHIAGVLGADFVFTTMAPLGPDSKPATPFPSATLTPFFSSRCRTGAAATPPTMIMRLDVFMGVVAFTNGGRPDLSIIDPSSPRN
jgi:hypothetical protein